MFMQLRVKPLSEMETNAAGDSPVLQTEKFSYFLPACECEMNGKLEEDMVIIKEATTGYLDPVSQQAVGNFITYVIEVGVRPGSMVKDMCLLAYLFLRMFKLGADIVISNYLLLI